MRIFWAGFLLFFILSCSKDDSVVSDVDTTITTWLATMNNDSATRDDSGVYYYATVENTTGTPVTTGSVVSIFYTLSDLEGNVIASHQRTDGDSLQLKQGVSAVFPIGLDVGLAFMNEGETFQMILPPSQAYQELTSGAIDRSLIALLEVEVVSVMDEATVFNQELLDIDNYILAENLNDTLDVPLNTVEQFPSGLSFKRLEKGFGELGVNGETIIVNYTATFLDGTEFDAKQNFQYILGSSEPRLLIPGFDFGVSLMKPLERSLLMIPSSQAYIESAFVLPSSITEDLVADAIIPEYVIRVGPYKTLLFDVTRFN